MMQRFIRTPAGVLVIIAVAAVAWLYMAFNQPGLPQAPESAPTTASSPTRVEATPANPTSRGVLMPPETVTATITQTVEPSQTATQPPPSLSAKTGAATCKIVAAQFARHIYTTQPDQQWVQGMAPIVSEELESVLPTVDRTAIPKGAPTATVAAEQPGACDVVVTWPDKARWLIGATNVGHGWLVESWSAM